MTEVSGAHPISKESLEKHVDKVNGHFSSIYRSASSLPENLSELVKDIGGDKLITPPEVARTIETMRMGFSLYYEMYAILEDKLKTIDSGIEQKEKNAFLGAYSMFAAASFIESEMETILGQEEAMSIDKWEFNFELELDQVLNGVLARYYSNVNMGKRNEILKKGMDLAKGTAGFFKLLREEALAQKTAFNPKLVDLVKGANFVIADKFTINGFEASFRESVKAKAAEFVPVYPHQVGGNVLAKTEMLRDMDRIVLYDLVVRKNPVIEIGGLSWSVLYYGLPGTGKSTLFAMGLTRLQQRCEQVSEFWKQKNAGKIIYGFFPIDPKVKSKFYGETGERVNGVVDQTRRPDRINIGLIDDLDLMFSGDRDSNSGGADKDILNILMQALAGTDVTLRERGNVQWWAATNAPTSIDAALLQRFTAKYEVDGPQEWYDFADILSNKLGSWIKKGIIQVNPGKDYKPFEMRKGETVYPVKEQGFLESLRGKFSAGMSLRDLGELCVEFKKKNPRFTGRPVDAVSDAVKKRINNYEIPEEWYSDPNLFFFKSYPDRVKMLEGLCEKITGMVIAEELERAYETEQKYANDKFESDVSRGMHEMEVRAEVGARLKIKYKGT